MTTLECAFRRDLIRPVFQSQKTTLPSPSPLLIHLPSGENPTWQAYPATECPAKRFLRFWRKLSVLYINIWLSRDCAAKYFPVQTSRSKEQTSKVGAYLRGEEWLLALSAYEVRLYIWLPLEYQSPTLVLSCHPTLLRSVDFHLRK